MSINTNNTNKIGGLRVKQQMGEVETYNTLLKPTFNKDILTPEILSEDMIKQLLNSTDYQDKRRQDKIYIEKNKNFKTVNISPIITYNVFNIEKIVDMTPPMGISIDDYE